MTLPNPKEVAEALDGHARFMEGQFGETDPILIQAAHAYASSEEVCGFQFTGRTKRVERCGMPEWRHDPAVSHPFVRAYLVVEDTK